MCGAVKWERRVWLCKTNVHVERFHPAPSLPTCLRCGERLIANAVSLPLPCDLAPSVPREARCFRRHGVLCTLECDSSLCSLFFSFFFYALTLVSHLVKRPCRFGVAMESRPDDDRVFNDCEQWAAGGQAHELSREFNAGIGARVISVSSFRLNTRECFSEAAHCSLWAYDIDLMSQLPS